MERAIAQKGFGIMTQSKEEKRAYTQGYNAGLRNKWPAHIPPYPPIKQIEQLMTQ